MKTEQINRTRDHVSLAYSLGYKIEPCGSGRVKMHQQTTAGDRRFEYVATISRSGLFEWLAPRLALIYNAGYAPWDQE